MQIPDHTATYLAEHGHATLLVPCDMPDEKFAGPTWYFPTLEDDDGELYPGPRTYGIYGCGWDRPAPHAPGDVIEYEGSTCPHCGGCGNADPWECSPMLCSCCRGRGMVPLHATVAKVLPPVQVEQLTGAEIEQFGIDVAAKLPVIYKCTTERTAWDAFANATARTVLLDECPELTATTRCWRVKVSTDETH